MRQLPSDIASDDDDEVPQVIFIEPEYGDSPVHFGFAPNDNHPPDPIGPGEHFLRDIYVALSSSPRWAQTMLVVIHDEHGGFFDHVAPLPVKIPVPVGALYQEPFVTTGVRVPALIASPFVRGGTCYRGNLDHTSLLQLFAEKFAGDRRIDPADRHPQLVHRVVGESFQLPHAVAQGGPAAPAQVGLVVA